jgi:hypothetical protein
VFGDWCLVIGDLGAWLIDRDGGFGFLKSITNHQPPI